MNATAKKTMVLEFRWTTSRARESYGYNVCTLYVDGVKVARCNGGGYDMQGTCLGDWISREYAARLLELTPEAMPAQSHWQYDRKKDGSIKYQGKRPMGKTIDDGRYFYGLTFHNPNYDPGKAKIGTDCNDRTMGGANGKTVEQAEAEGKSLGLERFQAFYTASSKVPTEQHTVPMIDGGCGFSEVQKIANAIGLQFRYLPTRKKDDSLYEMTDNLA